MTDTTRPPLSDVLSPPPGGMRDDDRESLSDDDEKRLVRIEKLLGDVDLTQDEHTETLAQHTKLLTEILDRLKRVGQ